MLLLTWLREKPSMLSSRLSRQKNQRLRIRLLATNPRRRPSLTLELDSGLALVGWEADSVVLEAWEEWEDSEEWEEWEEWVE